MAVDIIKDLVGVSLDPSLPPEERSSGKNRMSKMIIDATEPAKKLEFPDVCMPKLDVLAKVQSHWERYGLD